MSHTIRAPATAAEDLPYRRHKQRSIRELLRPASDTPEEAPPELAGNLVSEVQKGSSIEQPIPVAIHQEYQEYLDDDEQLRSEHHDGPIGIVEGIQEDCHQVILVRNTDQDTAVTTPPSDRGQEMADKKGWRRWRKSSSHPLGRWE